MVMLDIKKSYAYRQISKEAKINPETNELVEGEIFEKPKIKNTSGLGVKSDIIDLTKSILDFLIKTALNDSVSKEKKYDHALKELRKFNEEFKDCLINLKAERIGTPIRWQKKINAINAMKLYNLAVEKTFQYLSNGYLIYCNFENMKVIENLKIDITSGKLNAIAIPPKVDPDKVKDAFRRYGISFDQNLQWNKIFNKTCNRLLKCLEKESKGEKR